MPDQLPATVAALQARATDLLAELSPLEAGLAPGPVPAELRRDVAARARAAGLHDLARQPPAEHPQLSLAAVRETLAASNLRLAHLVIGAPPGVLAGVAEPLRSSHLEPLLAGARQAAFAFTEPDDPALATRARRDGDQLVVNGTKNYVTGGDTADFIHVVLEVVGDGDQPGGSAILVVDRDTPGVELAEVFTSLDGSTHAVLRFHDARVPAAHLVGAPGEGLPRAMGQIGDTRLAMAAEACGVMAWVCAWLEQHLLAAHPRGGRLADREGVRLRFGELRARAYAARSTLYRSARLADLEPGRKATVNEGMACKLFCTETACQVVDDALQLAGGRALEEQHPLARLYRRVRAWRFAEGASDVLRLNIARGRLELGAGRL